MNKKTTAIAILFILTFPEMLVRAQHSAQANEPQPAPAITSPSPAQAEAVPAQGPGQATEQQPAAVTVSTSPRLLGSNGAQPVSCPFCNLEKMDFSGRDLTDANFQGANLAGANLQGATLNGAILFGANLRGANLDNARLNKSSKGPADLSNADLTGASLKGAQFEGADLQYATHPENAHLFKGAILGPHPGASAGEKLRCGKADFPTVGHIYVDLKGTDNDTCGGSFAQACKTIAKALAKCSSTSCTVLVGYGEYQLDQTVQLRAGLSMYGGCVLSGKSDLQSLVLAPADGQPAFRGDNGTGSFLQGFRIQGSKATSPGAASIAIVLRRSAGLTLNDSSIIAGQGAVGGTGNRGRDGAAGGNATAADSGKSSCDSSANGGNGSVTMGVSVDVGFASTSCNPQCSANGCKGFNGGRGASGGSYGSGNCAECPSSRGGTGGEGAVGTNAGCGANGQASNLIAGWFNSSGWTPSAGSSGTNGGSGGGGGGGGAGGYKAGSCVWVPKSDAGNQGGGGGAGGCWGGGGEGGQQGGASVAVLLDVATLRVSETRIIGGKGGQGGAGGDGGKGGAAGNAAYGLSNLGGGYGGKGGNGGAGGAGGGGAGGNGGPAINVVFISRKATVDGSPIYYPGEAGLPGGGGVGGQAVASGTCTAPNGQQGKLGLVADTQSY